MADNGYLAKQIIEVRDRLEKLKIEKAELEGRQKALMESLKKHNCDTIEKGLNMIKELEKEIENANTVANSIIEKLKEMSNGRYN